MSRKVSLRLPDPLWAWLIARAGNRPVSAGIVDCLNQVKGGSGATAKLWLWGAVILAVGLVLLNWSFILRRKRNRKPDLRESF